MVTCKVFGRDLVSGRIILSVMSEICRSKGIGLESMQVRMRGITYIMFMYMFHVAPNESRRTQTIQGRSCDSTWKLSTSPIKAWSHLRHFTQKEKKKLLAHECQERNKQNSCWLRMLSGLTLQELIILRIHRDRQ